jgi:hypothetical protein
MCCDDSVVPSVATSYPEHSTIYRILQHAIRVVNVTGLLFPLFQIMCNIFTKLKYFNFTYKE